MPFSTTFQRFRPVAPNLHNTVFETSYETISSGDSQESPGGIAQDASQTMFVRLFGS